MSFSKIKNTLKSRKFKYELLSLAMLMVLIVLIVTLNVLVGALSEHYPLSIDLTKDNFHQISKESVEYVKSLKKPIEITVMFDSNNVYSAGNYYTHAINILKEYPKYNKGITLTEIDPVRNPTYSSSYQGITLEYGDILIESEFGYKKIRINDLFNSTTDPYTQQTYIVSSKAEQEITSAIMQVLQETQTTITFLTGHGETIPEGYIALLEQNGYKVTKTNLLSDTIDDNVSIAVWAAPSLDIDSNGIVAEKLNEFLYNNGKNGKTLYFSPPTLDYDTPNIFAFLRQWGISYEDAIVYESEADKVIYNLPYLTLTEYCTNEEIVANYLTKMKAPIPVVMPAGREMRALFSAQNGYTVTTGINYSQTSYAIPKSVSKDWEPLQSHFHSRPALLETQYVQYDQLTPLISRIVAFSSGDVWADEFINQPAMGNAEFLLAMTNTLTQKEDTFYIQPKTLDVESLAINQMQVFVLSAFFTLLVPVGLLVIGMCIWLRYRRK